MQAVLPALGRSGWVISTSNVAATCVSISFGTGLRCVRKQRTAASGGETSAIWRCQQQTRPSSSAQKAKDLNQQSIDKEMSNFDDALEEEKEKQVRAPWQREGVDQPPVSRPRSAGAMTKGMVLVRSFVLWSND
jgi:hypothetical protein